MPMKLICILTFGAFLPLAALAQSIDYNKIVLPEKVIPNNFEERLIQLAWKNHPANKMVLQNVDIAHREKNQARFKWLDDIYAAGNLNEYTLKKQETVPGTLPTNIFFPRYNFGIRFSLGTFFNIPGQVKIADGKLINAEYAVDEKKLLLREEILGDVEKLKQFYKFVKLRRQIKEDFFTMYKDAEKRFSTGEMKIEGFRAAVQSYYNQAESVVEAQANFNGVKINLEALVGVELSDVEGYSDFISKLDAELKLE